MDLNRGAVCAEEEEASQLNAKQSPTITNKIWMQPSSQQLTLRCPVYCVCQKVSHNAWVLLVEFIFAAICGYKKKGVAEK